MAHEKWAVRALVPPGSSGQPFPPPGHKSQPLGRGASSQSPTAKVEPLRLVAHGLLQKRKGEREGGNLRFREVEAA